MTRPSDTLTPTRRPDEPQRAMPTARRGRRLLLGIAGLIALLAAALIWYVNQDAPAAVDIDAASAAIADAADTADTGVAANGADTEDTAAGDTGGTAADTQMAGEDTSAGTGGDISGTWAVDPSIGQFSVSDTTGTFVGFRVAEELTTLGQVEAVGRTPDVSGTVTIDDTTLMAGEIVADLTTVVSDESRREDAIQRALGTDANPTAIFVVTQPVELGGDLSDGQVVAVDVPGTLTVAGVARDVVAPLQIALQEDTAIVTGSLDVTFADHGVAVPSAPIVVSVEETGTIELQLYLTRA